MIGGKKKKSKSTSADLANGHPSKAEKKKKAVIDDEEIASDTDIETDDEQTNATTNGPVRLDNLLNDDADDDEGNIHEQRLQRAKEYIEQIAKQGETNDSNTQRLIVRF